MTDGDLSQAETRIELLAGNHPVSGQPIFEQLLATPAEGEHHFTLLKSPMFVRGVAAQDTVTINPAARGRFNVVERRGLLAVRVFFRQPDAELEGTLSAEMEKLGGSIDVRTERALVFSIHFGVGFSSIENLLNKLTAGKDAQWQYGNVYHPDSGEPLNWWQALLTS